MVDLAIGLLPQLEAGFYQRRLFDQDYVCLMRKNHPLAAKKLELADFEHFEHVIIEAQGTGHCNVEKELARNGMTKLCKLRLAHFTSAPYIVAETDLVATVIEKLALQTAERFDLIVKPHPADMPLLQINMFWHRRYHQDSGNVWMRNVIFDLFSE